jgi:hypothetical protein
MRAPLTPSAKRREAVLKRLFFALVSLLSLNHQSLGKNFVSDGTWQKKQNHLFKNQHAKELGIPLLTNDPILDERDIQKAEWEKKKQTEKEKKNEIPDDFETFLPSKKDTSQKFRALGIQDRPWRKRMVFFWEQEQKEK